MPATNCVDYNIYYQRETGGPMQLLSNRNLNNATERFIECVDDGAVYVNLVKETDISMRSIRCFYKSEYDRFMKVCEVMDGI